MSDKNMDKVAGQVPGVMGAAAQHLRKMAGQNIELVKRAEVAEHEVKVMKIARRMDQRGLEPNLSFEEKTAMLRDMDPEKLGSLEQAIELTAGGFRLGHVEQPEEKRASRSGGEMYGSTEAGSDMLEDFVTNQKAYGEG